MSGGNQCGCSVTYGSAQYVCCKPNGHTGPHFTDTPVAMIGWGHDAV